MFGTVDGGAVVVVVSEVPGCAGGDGLSASPAGGAASGDRGGDFVALAVVVAVVASGLSSAALFVAFARVLWAVGAACWGEVGAVG